MLDILHVIDVDEVEYKDIAALFKTAQTGKDSKICNVSLDDHGIDLIVVYTGPKKPSKKDIEEYLSI